VGCYFWEKLIISISSRRKKKWRDETNKREDNESFGIKKNNNKEGEKKGEKKKKGGSVKSRGKCKAVTSSLPHTSTHPGKNWKRGMKRNVWGGEIHQGEGKG